MAHVSGVRFRTVQREFGTVRFGCKIMPDNCGPIKNVSMKIIPRCPACAMLLIASYSRGMFFHAFSQFPPRRSRNFEHAAPYRARLASIRTKFDPRRNGERMSGDLDRVYGDPRIRRSTKRRGEQIGFRITCRRNAIVLVALVMLVIRSPYLRITTVEKPSQ